MFVYYIGDIVTIFGFDYPISNLSYIQNMFCITNSNKFYATFSYEK